MVPPDAVYRRFKALAAERPADTAVEVDGASCSYGDLLRRVERCAAGLRARGVGSGDAIAIAFPNSLDFIVSVFAVFALNGFAVPLNPRFKQEEFRHALRSTNCRALLYPPDLRDLLAAADAVAIRETSIAALEADVEPGADLGRGGAPDATGVYMFSSGSSGKSKRIHRTQAQWLGEYEALRDTIALAPSDRILCTVPLYHAHGFGNALLAALLTGARLVLSTPEFNARATMRALASGVTVYPAVPFMFKLLAETRFSTPPDLGSVRLLFSAGAPLEEAVCRRFLEQYGKPIAQLYGSTETGAISINALRPGDKPRSVGLPLPGTRVVVRTETGEPALPHEVGDVWVNSPNMARQYDDLPDATAESFASGYFLTGDTGFLDEDGYLYLTGRKKLLINVAGYKVDPLEVEDVLRVRPDVADVVVVGDPHPGYGEKVRAIVVRRSDSRTTAQELREYAARRLAEYKVPKVIEFREEIPRSPLGKILRKYL